MMRTHLNRLHRRGGACHHSEGYRMGGKGPTCSMQTAHNNIRTIHCWDTTSSYTRGRSSEGSFGAEWCHCEAPEARERLYDERVGRREIQERMEKDSLEHRVGIELRGSGRASAGGAPPPPARGGGQMLRNGPVHTFALT